MKPVSATTGKRIDALIADELRPGERAIRSGCSDMTPCRCVHHVKMGHECTVVGRADGLDRCLMCGAVWRSRDSGEQRLVVVDGGVA